MLSQMRGCRRSTRDISSTEWIVIRLEMTFGPVHITSMSGSSLVPTVFRYSDCETVGTALEAQYSVGQKKNLDG